MKKRLPAFIPANAKWYLADLVLAISVGSSRSRTVHINTVLIRADNPTDAHFKAVVLGREAASVRYSNGAGEAVRFRFLGLKELQVIQEDLVHGAELQFRELGDQTVAQARAHVRPKAKLGVFARRSLVRAGSDYAEGALLRELQSRGLIPPRSRKRSRRGSHG